MMKFRIFIIIVIVFGIIFNIIGVKVGNVLKDETAKINEYKRELARIPNLNQSEQINTLFIGSSLISCGLIPEVFDSVMRGKTKSYNLGMLGLAYEASYFLVKDYLKFNKAPDYLLIELIDFDPKYEKLLFSTYIIEGATFGNIVSLIGKRENHNFIYRYFFPANQYNEQILKYFKSSIFNPEVIDSANYVSGLLFKSLKANNGYCPYPFYTSLKPINKKRQEFFIPHNTEIDLSYVVNNKSFNDIIKISMENRVKVILILPPRRIGDYLQFSSYPVFLKLLEKKYPGIIISESTYKLNMYPTSDYTELAHLNYSGSKKFTIQLANELNKKLFIIN